MPDSAIWKPHVTVAAIIEREGRYLLVRESIGGRDVYNQPAGHLDPGESLQQAVIREVREETAYPFSVDRLIGIYRYQPDPNESAESFLRFAFSGHVGEPLDTPLDHEIIDTHWLSLEQIRQLQSQHRSPMVLQCILDYQKKATYPLDVFSSDFN